MKINTIEELKQRIGKFVVFSEYNENCNDKFATMKLLTKIENIEPWILKAYPNRQGFFGYKIWGKFSANFKTQFLPYAVENNIQETYSNCYVYARDPTEEELKMFKNNWRIKKYLERNI